MFGCFKFKNVIIVTAICALIVVLGFSSVSIVENISADKTSENSKVYIIMYHSILKDDTKVAEYRITPVQLEKDILWLKENGYETVGVSDIIDYVYEKKPLPDKCVMLTFDDGFLNNLEYALPLLKKYNYKAVVSVVGSYSQMYSEVEDRNVNYAYLSWADVNTLVKDGYVEIANHSYDMHSINNTRKGSRINKGESFSQYRNVFIADTMKFQNLIKERCVINPVAYAYPFGFSCDEGDKILKDLGFKVTFNCNEHVNYLTDDPECLFELGRYNRSGYVSTEDFMEKVFRN